jgi:hypothetical protein
MNVWANTDSIVWEINAEELYEGVIIETTLNYKSL